MDKITHILENVVRCKYFEVCVHIKNPTKNSYQGGLGLWSIYQFETRESLQLMNIEDD